jgi:hypothetical protein
VSADNEAFTGWVAKMKAHFKDSPAPVGTGKPAAAPPAAAPAKQAQASQPGIPAKG